MALKVIVIGSGAREHAIAHTLLKGESVESVYCIPGNPGMEKDGIICVNLSTSNHAALVDFATEKKIDWVFVGPENPLIDGIVDEFESHGIKAFGPGKQAAQIEGSKNFAKELMKRHNIPTAEYRTFSDHESAADYVHSHGAPIVVKADGLAAGKGVTVALDEETAIAALNDIFVDRRFGDAGACVVIEDFLEGQEFSLMSFVRGNEFWTMPISQDHKRAYDGDKGPNTGGMGAYSPVPQISDETVAKAVETIVAPVTQGMADEGMPFNGVLYAGLIATADGPKVIEFNARFGDPETEVVLPKLKSDLGKAINAILSGEEPEFEWDTEKTTLGVVLAAEGYPGKPNKGFALHDIDLSSDPNAHIYAAGVARRGHDADEEAGIAGSAAGSAANADSAANSNCNLAASGGRVLLVETTADDIKQAQEKLYAIIENADTSGLFYRKDIGSKALAMSKK